MKVLKDVNGHYIRLTEERFAHISKRHFEVVEMLQQLGTVLSGPVVVAKITESDAWILTAWLTGRVR